jgi:hypothetical protein
MNRKCFLNDETNPARQKKRAAKQAKQGKQANLAEIPCGEKLRAKLDKQLRPPSGARMRGRGR